MSINDIIMAEANKYRGTWEWAGDEHNPKVLAMYVDAGHPEIRNDEVPWCAAFIGAVLGRVGLQNTGSLLAKSYLNWGTKVSKLEEAEVGDIVVLNRGTAQWQGHIGFLVGFDASHVHLLGGNQGNQVNVSKYPISSIAGIRRVKQPRTNAAQSTTVGAATSGGVAAVASGVTAVSQLDGNAQLLAVGAAVVCVIAFVWIFRERIKKWRGGTR